MSPADIVACFEDFLRGEFRELLIAGEDGCEAEEGEEVGALSLVPDGGPAVAEEPGDRLLDLPAVPAEPLADPIPGPAVRGASPRCRSQVRCSAEKYAVSARSLTGRRRGTRRERTAGIPRISGLRVRLSWVPAPDTATAEGVPSASDSTCSLLPSLPRSTGFSPVSVLVPFWPGSARHRRSSRPSPARLAHRVRPELPGGADATAPPGTTR